MHFYCPICYCTPQLFFLHRANSDTMKWCIAYIALCISILDCAEVCRQKFARLLVGYRCITNTENYTVIANIPSHICNHQCMTRSSCFLVNYDFANNMCLLSEEACTLMIRDEASRTGHFHKIKPRGECVYWTPMGTEDKARSIWSRPCADSVNECQVGRLTKNSEVSTGKYQPHKPQVVAIFDGFAKLCRTPDCDPEVLQVHPDCYVAWLSFNSTTDPVPPIAVQGGYLTGGIRQFVMRVFLFGNAIYGVYMDGAIGYVPHQEKKIFHDMELLVVFWTLWYIISRFQQTWLLIEGYPKYFYFAYLKNVTSVLAQVRAWCPRVTNQLLEEPRI